MFDFNRTRRASERLLLKHCYENVVEEQERFAQLSYSREIECAIRGVLDGHPRGLRFQLPEEEVADLVADCIQNVYANWHPLPSLFRDLRESVRRFAMRYANAYLKRAVSRPAFRGIWRG